MATKEIVGAHADGDYYHSSELKNSRHASQGGGVIGNSLVVTVTEANRVITVPAFTADVPDGAGGLVRVSHAGAGVNVTASHATLPRNDLLTLDSAGNLGMVDGAATAETGDVADAPHATLDDDEILLAVVRSPAAQANVLAADVKARAIDVSENTQFTTKGTTIASGAYALPATNRQYYHISGTTTLAELGTKPAGFVLVFEFEGSLTLTHDATNLVLIGGLDYVTSPGDVLGFISEGSGDWRQIFGPGYPRTKYKTTGQNFEDTNLATVTATAGNIQFPVRANRSYKVTIDLHTSALGTAGGGGIKYGFTFPAAHVIARAMVLANHSGLTDVTTVPSGMFPITAGMVTVVSGTAFGGADHHNTGIENGLIEPGPAQIVFYFVNGANAGDIVFQAAQNTDSGTTTITFAHAVCEELG